jgi:hypothetical protein
MPIDGDSELYAGVREAVEERLREDGTWSAAFSPLADEYVAAARLAAKFRAIARRRPFHTSKRTGRVFAHPGHAAADREARRMMAIAGVLELAPRRAASAKDPFAELDELTTRREQRVPGGPAS